MATKPTITIGEIYQSTSNVQMGGNACELQYASDTFWNCTILERQFLFDGRNRDALRSQNFGRHPVKRFAHIDIIIETGLAIMRMDDAAGEELMLRRRFNLTQHIEGVA